MKCYSHGTIENEKVLSWVFHDVVTKMVDEVGNSCALSVLVLCRNSNGEIPFIGEQHLQSPAKFKSNRSLRLFVLMSNYLNSTVIGMLSPSFISDIGARIYVVDKVVAG